MLPSVFFSRVYIHTSSSLKHVRMCSHTHTRALPAPPRSAVRNISRACKPTHLYCILSLPDSSPSSTALEEKPSVSAHFDHLSGRRPFWGSSRCLLLSGQCLMLEWDVYRGVYFLSGSLEKLLHPTALERPPLNVIDWAVWRPWKDENRGFRLFRLWRMTSGSITDGCCNFSCSTPLSRSM